MWYLFVCMALASCKGGPPYMMFWWRLKLPDQMRTGIFTNSILYAVLTAHLMALITSPSPLFFHLYTFLCSVSRKSWHNHDINVFFQLSIMTPIIHVFRHFSFPLNHYIFMPPFSPLFFRLLIQLFHMTIISVSPFSWRFSIFITAPFSPHYLEPPLRPIAEEAAVAVAAPSVPPEAEDLTTEGGDQTTEGGDQTEVGEIVK